MKRKLQPDAVFSKMFTRAGNGFGFPWSSLPSTAIASTSA